MKILTIIPLAKGIPRDELSYFSAKEVPLGALVTVPFGNRNIRGVVVDQNNVRDLKSSIKSNDFALRNVSQVHDELLPGGVFAAGQKTARFFAAPIGAVLQTMIPIQIFDYYLDHPVSLPGKNLAKPEIQALQVPLSERISYYKTLIRENLAKNVSTMIIAPTVIQAEKIFAAAQGGIEDKIAIAHSKKTKKHIGKVIARVIEKKDPVVLIATAPYASLIRPDWACVILETSSSSHYRYDFNPIFDMRFFVEEIAKWYGARILYADTLISSEIRYRVKKQEITDARTTWHIAKPENFQVIDMKTKPLSVTDVQKTKTKFQIFDTKTITLLQEAVIQKGNLLLLSTRKGLAPLTACSDCGATVACPVCGTPLVLHRKNTKDSDDTKRIYMCHHCMHTTLPTDTCAQCGGWRLAMLGISTDRIREELGKLFPQLKTFVCDGDTATTPPTIQKTIATWQKNPSALIITPPMIPYIESAEYGTIVSLDSLISLPSYTSGETALGTALAFLEKINRGATVQTRNFDNDVIQAINNENIFDFMKFEQESRATFSYPPAKILVKISIVTKKTDTKEATKYLETIFKAYDPDILIKRGKKIDTLVVTGMIKVERDIWNDLDHDIHHIISELSKDFRKEVNPESVL